MPFEKGDKNPSWKGDEVKYVSLHLWVRSRKTEPSLCENCKKVRPVDLANKNGNYNRNLNEWWYLCRKCHMEIDGRNNKLRLIGKSRRIPDKKCSICKKTFHRVSGMKTAKYCSLRCYWNRNKNIQKQ